MKNKCVLVSYDTSTSTTFDKCDDVCSSWYKKNEGKKHLL